MKFDIKKISKKNLLVVGIGNSLKGDDGAGCEVIKHLEGKTTCQLLDVGSAPENYTKKIIELQPDTIIFIDAVEMGEKPGVIKIIDEKEIAISFFTTHNMPLNLFLDYIKQQTKAEVIFIGIQAKSMKFGDTISSPVKKAIEKLVNIFH